MVDYAFEQSLITDITAVQNDYWELVFARGNVDVQVNAVDLAQRLYDDNKRQVEVGTLAPIEIVRAEAQLATAQQNLILAQTAQRQQQSLLMSVIARNPISPLLRDAEIIPTDTVQAPPTIENIPLPDAVNEAVGKRPDVLEAKTNIDADDINLRVSKNGLLPTLNLSAFVASTGLGGNTKTTTTTTTSVVGRRPAPPISHADRRPQQSAGDGPESERRIGADFRAHDKDNGYGNHDYSGRSEQYLQFFIHGQVS